LGLLPALGALLFATFLSQKILLPYSKKKKKRKKKNKRLFLPFSFEFQCKLRCFKPLVEMMDVNEKELVGQAAHLLARKPEIKPKRPGSYSPLQECAPNDLRTSYKTPS
jgi:hypothetical protein